MNLLKQTNMLTKHRLAIITLTLCVLLSAGFASAESIAVIANPAMKEDLDENAISRIFLGKTNNYPSGAPALAVDLAEGNPARAEFQKSVLKKSDAQLKSYWAKQIFTAQGTPPKSTDNIEKLIILVSKNPSVITYIPLNKVPDNVRIVATF